jgi:hypothetical protein
MAIELPGPVELRDEGRLMSTTLERIIEEVKTLTRQERRELLRQLEHDELAPENLPLTPRRPGTLRGTVKYMAPDFDAPLDNFTEYME